MVIIPILSVVRLVPEGCTFCPAAIHTLAHTRVQPGCNFSDLWAMIRVLHDNYLTTSKRKVRES